MKIIGILIVFFCTSQLVTGQELYGRFLDHEQGLLSSECYDIHISEKGYLLVSTQYGPMKFDGEQFIPICLNLPVERRIIYDFERDSKGKVYLLNSKNEIFTLVGDKAIFLCSRKQEVNEGLHWKKLHWYPKGLVIFSNTTYRHYSFKTKKVSFDPKYETMGFNKFVYDPEKEFPFERYKMIKKRVCHYSIDFKSHQKTIAVDHFSSSEAREDIIRFGKQVYLLINHELFEAGSETLRTFPHKNILFIEAFHNRIWLCTTSGLIELDQQGNFIQCHFPGQVIGGVAPLKNGGIAVSLNQNGIFIASNIHERQYKNLKPTEVAGNGNQVLIGNKSGELFQIRNSLITPAVKAPNWNPAAQLVGWSDVRSIEFIDNQWHICTMTSFYTLSKDLKSQKIINSNPNNSFNNFFYLKKIAYGFSWSDLFLMDSPISHAVTQVPFIRCKHTLNDSVVLLGSENGLYEYHYGAKHLIRSKLISKPYYISNIQQLRPEELLITTRYKGIFHFKNGKLLKKYAPPCISVKKSFISDGQIFSAGNEGVFTKPLSGSGKIPWTKIFDGEIQNMFLSHKTLFICIKNDLITREINSLYQSRKTVVFPNELLIGNQKVARLPVRIGYNVPISFDFDILRFDAHKLGLYYKLKGESQVAQYTEGTKISFEALQSGSYELEIFPVVDGDVQFSTSKKYRFIVEEPFWRSTLFYLLISIVVLLILLSVRLVRKLQRKKRSAERAKLESKLNEYKLLAVKAQVNPHFLSNGLAAIQALILREDNDLAAQYLAKFSYLMRKILNYSEQQFISIGDELQLVDAYLELELLRFQNKFEIRKSIQLNEEQLKNYSIPSLLLQPILENAIWHGLKFQENNPVLYISFEIDAHQELIIQIRDNGHGFQKHNTSEKHLSKGNQLISERIDTLNKQFETPVASLDIQSSPNGTMVQFTFNPKLYNTPS